MHVASINELINEETLDEKSFHKIIHFKKKNYEVHILYKS